MTVHHQHTEHANFEARAKASLNTSLNTIDKITRDDLARIRRDALSSAKPAKWLNFSWLNFRRLNNHAWAPLGALSFCLFIAVFFVLQTNTGNKATQNFAQQSPMQNQPDKLANLELLSNIDDFDTASDPGFYIWMDDVMNNENAKNAV